MLNISLLTLAAAGVGSLSGHLKALFAQSVVQGSLVRSTSAARVEPITLIDSDLEYAERLDDTLNYVINLFSGIWLQALALSDTTIAGTQIIKRLEASNPTSGPGGLIGASLESLAGTPVKASILDDTADLYRHGLPSLESYLSLESRFAHKANRKDDTKEEEKKNKEGLSISKATDSLKDMPALSFGKLLNVDIRADGETFSIPVTVRLATTLAKNDVLVDAMQHRFSRNETALERKVKWKTGSIRLIQDAILCTDLVRNHHKRLISDTDGIYAKLSPDTPKAFVKAGISGQASVSQASNILVLSQTTADRVESLTGGRFSDTRFRQRMFESTGIMILAVIDTDNDYVTLYMDAIANEQTISGRNLRNVSKKDGPDINEVMKLMVTGQGSLLR